MSRDTWAVDTWHPVELNRYGYVANNPVNAFDPSGLMADYADVLTFQTTPSVPAGSLGGVALQQVDFWIMLLILAAVANSLAANPVPDIFPAPEFDDLGYRRGEGECFNGALQFLNDVADVLEKIGKKLDWFDESSLIVWIDAAKQPGYLTWNGAKQWPFHVYISVQTPVGGAVLDNSLGRWVLNSNADTAVEQYQRSLGNVKYRHCIPLQLDASALRDAAKKLRNTVEDVYYKGICNQRQCRHN